jgi:arylsulfatase A-like enzyme
VQRYAAKAEALGPESDDDFMAEREAVTKLRQDHATYAAMVESTDQSVGRILDRLDSLGFDDNTVVMFVSDNGGLSTLMRRSFNQATSNRPLRAGKGWLYEGGIRAPLIVRWPGTLAAGRTVEAPVTSTDLFPTLLDLIGVKQRPQLQLDGASLGPLLNGESAGPHAALYWHFPHYHGSGNRPGGAIRVGDLKLLEWFEDGAIELYDLSSDLGERRDLAVERPEDARRLLAALREWRTEVGANMPLVR